MTRLLLYLAPPELLAVAETDAEPPEPTEFGIGSVVLAVVVGAVLVWLGYLWINSRRRRGAAVEETPKNLQPYLSDDALESNRLNRVLSAAVISAAVLAIAMPIYYLDESNRQAEAAEAFEEVDVEEGHEWYVKFACVDCHGPDGGGGGAPFIERRSGLEVSWAAPSINDVFYRYSEDEERFWIVHGRAGTPMPAAGLEGGGAMTEQEVDQVLAYLHSIQIPQSEVLAEIEPSIDRALARIAGGDEAVALAIARQELVVEDILEAPDRFELIEDLPTRLRIVLGGDGTCTPASAALIGVACNRGGTDSDRDGLADDAERQIEEIAAEAAAGAPIRDTATPGLVPNPAFAIELDPADAFTMEAASGEPMPDLDAADAFLNELDTVHLNLRVTAERQDRFLEGANQSLLFLQESAAERAWIPAGIEVVEGDGGPSLDATALASDMGVSGEVALRAVGLFNGYCARCHTAGYAAGVPFEQAPGSGAWAPALEDGRSLVQFPDVEDQIRFIVNGSELGSNYGVNGLGRGWMPGFGQILTEEDIALIVAYERTL